MYIPPEKQRKKKTDTPRSKKVEIVSLVDQTFFKGQYCIDHKMGGITDCCSFAYMFKNYEWRCAKIDFPCRFRTSEKRKSDKTDRVDLKDLIRQMKEI